MEDKCQPSTHFVVVDIMIWIDICTIISIFINEMLSKLYFFYYKLLRKPGQQSLDRRALCELSGVI